MATLADLRAELLGRIRDEINSWAVNRCLGSGLRLVRTCRRERSTATSTCSSFGRGARADLGTWVLQGDELGQRIPLWSGNHAGLVEISEEDLPRLRQERPPIVTELLRDAIVVHGPAAAVFVR